MNSRDRCRMWMQYEIFLCSREWMGPFVNRRFFQGASSPKVRGSRPDSRNDLSVERPFVRSIGLDDPRRRDPSGMANEAMGEGGRHGGRSCGTNGTGPRRADRLAAHPARNRDRRPAAWRGRLKRRRLRPRRPPPPNPHALENKENPFRPVFPRLDFYATSPQGYYQNDARATGTAARFGRCG